MEYLLLPDVNYCCLFGCHFMEIHSIASACNVNNKNSRSSSLNAIGNGKFHEICSIFYHFQLEFKCFFLFFFLFSNTVPSILCRKIIWICYYVIYPLPKSSNAILSLDVSLFNDSYSEVHHFITIALRIEKSQHNSMHWKTLEI